MSHQSPIQHGPLFIRPALNRSPSGCSWGSSINVQHRCCSSPSCFLASELYPAVGSPVVESRLFPGCWIACSHLRYRPSLVSLFTCNTISPSAPNPALSSISTSWLRKDTLSRGRRAAGKATEAPHRMGRTESREEEGGGEAKQGLTEELVGELVTEALAWASLHGLVVGDKAVPRSGTRAGVGMVHAPLSLLPSPFPQHAVIQAIELAPLFNLLIDRVSQDGQFLQQALARTRKADDFTARLLDIHLQILEEGVKQDIQLGLHRSDYMLDTATGALLQVEVNTISSSFAGLGPLVSSLHRYLINRSGDFCGLEVGRIPENRAGDEFAEALALAWKEFGNNSAAILMLVHAEERNMYDQYWLAYKLYNSYGVKVIRRTLAQVDAEAKLGTNGALHIGEQPVSVVYYRTGYVPVDYPSETEWRARLLLERSAAVKCPSISYHLAGAKKIQQELAKPGVVEKFVQDKKAVGKIRECFAGLWGLEDENSAEIIERAIQKPDGFVLKPQREGGGNNIYGADVSTTLKRLQQENGGAGLAAYILMQRIFPPSQSSYLVRDGIWSLEETVSELGIFSTYLRNGEKEVLNKQAGHLLRTKVAQSNEGGVAAGFAVLDSPYLT